MTWTQVRQLTHNAKELLLEMGKPLTPTCYFLAFLSILSAAPEQVQGISYWAYVPNPPILQPVGWLDKEPIKVLTNDSVRLGRTQDTNVRLISSSYINFKESADSLPICLTLQGKAPRGCFTTGYKTFLTDAPDPDDQDKRLMWELQMQILGHPLYKEKFVEKVDVPLPPYIQKFRDKNQFWDSSLTKYPAWLQCSFPHTATWYTPKNMSDLGLKI